MRRLEAQYEHERKIWQEELKEERRARREDIRVLREAMYSLYKVVEQDIPRQFEYVEDKIEGLVDCQQQLQERVMTVDDSTMALEDRVANLEDEQDSNDEGAVDDEDEVVGESTEQYGSDMAALDTSLAGRFPASGSDEASIKSAEASRTHLDDQDQSFQLPPNPLHAVNPAQLKRKRHGVDHEMAEFTAESRHSFTLPSPPPLSLSSPDQGPCRCHSEPSIAPYSSFGLTN
ncbi:hypothetical protein DTO164E3_2976 [Paecilomyces variotii]|nr:hypothetical protein DTO164E3_2976 [Paecilomyces variotii]KAJ9209105.1 hypothetical protein DTO032I3_322 [Paecilomyces variotii]KAJ9282985.1 hypothetical protein DTO021D3_322 [Paecilomyces variotii]KAJ9343811.1 hypothetical protein DTO027B6_3636 [Paecilomyces variotii]KAJ9386986.1 hypothetical protein DTO032I4_3430 [Paecilomyces variotii]